MMKSAKDRLSNKLAEPVGLPVTDSDISRRRSCLRMTRTKSNRKPAVGTIRKSMAAMPAAWL